MSKEDHIKATMTTDYVTKCVNFVMTIPTEYIFMTSETSDYFYKMQQVNVSRSEILLLMAKMLKKIEEGILSDLA